MQRTDTHPFARQLEIKHAQGRQYERRTAIRQAAIRPRGSAIEMPRSTKKVDAFDEGRPVMPLQQDVEAARQSAKRADADRAGPTQTRTTGVPHADRDAVADATRKTGRERMRESGG